MSNMIPLHTSDKKDLNITYNDRIDGIDCINHNFEGEELIEHTRNFMPLSDGKRYVYDIKPNDNNIDNNHTTVVLYQIECIDEGNIQVRYVHRNDDNDVYTLYKNIMCMKNTKMRGIIKLDKNIAKSIMIINKSPSSVLLTIIETVLLTEHDNMNTNTVDLLLERYNTITKKNREKALKNKDGESNDVLPFIRITIFFIGIILLICIYVKRRDRMMNQRLYRRAARLNHHIYMRPIQMNDNINNDSIITQNDTRFNQQKYDALIKVRQAGSDFGPFEENKYSIVT